MSEQTAWERFFDAHAPVYEDNVFTFRVHDHSLDRLAGTEA